MARPLRIEFAGALYHVTSRGNERKPIYRDDHDRARFLERLAAVVNRPDLALTLERHGGWYRAATVLYPGWAFRHARLLSRPNSEWLGGLRRDVIETVAAG